MAYPELNAETPKQYLLVGVDTRDYSTTPFFYAKTFATMKEANATLLRKVLDDYESGLPAEYECYLNGDELTLGTFHRKYGRRKNLSGVLRGELATRVAIGDCEGGVIEYSITEVEQVEAH